MITLRFYVREVAKRAGDDNYYVKLAPAYANGANADWAKYTPTGSIELTVNSEGGKAQLQEWLNEGGKPVDLHITMTPVVEQ